MDINDRKQIGLGDVVSISVTTAIGGSLLGIPGLALGFASGIADMYLIKLSIQEKHNIGCSFFVSSILYKSNIFLPNQMIFYVAGTIVITSSYYFLDDFLNYETRVSMSVDALISLNKIFNIITNSDNAYNQSRINKFYTQYIEIYNNKFIQLSLGSTAIKMTNIGIEYLFLTYIGIYGKGLFINNLLSTTQRGNFDSTSKIGLKITSFFVIKEFFQFITIIAENYLYTEQSKLLMKKSTEMLLDKNNARKLIADPQQNVFISNFKDDLQELLFQSHFKLNEEIQKITKLLFALNNIINDFPAGILIYIFISSLKQYSTKYITANFSDLNQETFYLYNKLSKTTSHISTNIDNINLRDGNDFIKDQYNKYLMQYAKISHDSSNILRLHFFINNLASLLKQYTDSIYLSYKFFLGYLSLTRIPLTKQSLDDITEFLSGKAIYEIDASKHLLMQQRINDFLSVIDSKLINNITRSFNTKNKIIIDDYTMLLHNNSLLHIDHLEFSMGYNYAFTGKSGCGKTSFFIDLKEGIYKPFSSKGSISFPSNATIMFIDQHTYMPSDTTLLKKAYFPQTLDESDDQNKEQIKKKVKHLFQELEMDEFVYDNEGIITMLENNDFKLSGGQLKKIATIQAIMYNPDILFIDELTSGLDSKSLAQVKFVLNKYLSHTLILSIDHYTNTNDSFYNAIIHFDKELGITIQPITSQEKETELDGICQIKDLMGYYPIENICVF